MAGFCREHDVSIRTMALQYGAGGHDGIASTPIGCRTPEEVDQCVDDLLAEVPPEMWLAFHEAFDARVRKLGREDHWFYDKATADIGND